MIDFKFRIDDTHCEHRGCCRFSVVKLPNAFGETNVSSSQSTGAVMGSVMVAAARLDVPVITQ